MMDTSKMVFVFGSNTAGIHGGGAAKEAYKNKGARWGLSYGHFGQSFAIPTKGHKETSFKSGLRMGVVVGDTLSLADIELYIWGFLAYAKHHPELDFQVTCLGCGLAGLSHADVAPLFRHLRMDTLPNVYFDDLWRPYLCKSAKFWGTF